MAGPWFVDPDNGLTTNDGLSVSTPWKLIPRQTGATAQTGYGVVAGDVINVKNGSRSALRVVFPANNLTYRGYGVASNILSLTLPKPSNPAKTYVRRVAREWGTHEGMWVIDAPTETLSIINFVGRSGCVIEDCHVIGTSSITTISIGTSGLMGAGATVRRCRVSGSDSQGLQAYTTGVTFEDVLIEDIDEDGCTLAANATNSYRASTSDVIRRVSIVNPGKDPVASIGDAFQTLRLSERFESALLIEDLYVYKTSAVKQAVVLSDVLGGCVMRRFHIANGGTGQAQILFTGLGASCLVEDGYMEGGGNTNAAFRFDGPQGLEADASLTIRHVIAKGHAGGFFAWGSSNEACPMDGDVTLTNNYGDGAITQALSFSGGISCHPGAAVTIGAGASLTAQNNVMLFTGQPAFRLPSGGGNDARWVFQNNRTNGATFAIGSTSYATPTLFQAAHNAATNNTDGDPLVSTDFRPLDGSPLLTGGADLGYVRDIERKQGRKYIGAYTAATLMAV